MTTMLEKMAEAFVEKLRSGGNPCWLNPEGGLVVVAVASDVPSFLRAALLTVRGASGLVPEGEPEPVALTMALSDRMWRDRIDAILNEPETT